MNGFGIGTVVALGIAIAVGLRSPDIQGTEVIITVVFWSFLSGLIFEAYRIALAHKPSR